MDPRNFLAELKRRNVYRVAVAYAIIAWLLVQIATQTFPFFAIPNWGVRLVVFLVVLGFPVALVFAWIFELTPEGLKRTEDIAPHESITRRTGQKLDFIIIAVLLAAIGFLLWNKTPPVSRPAGGIPEKSIAVLPFENLSDEKENAFFADGIQDDILTSLAKIRDLKVTSRTSVMGFRGKETRNLREIGKALGVAHILQGSVRRDGNRVRVSAQLLDARTDDHLWAENYNRTLSDVLTLQAELATEIAARLKATLSPEEKASVARKPTSNPDAYVFYLRGRQAEFHPDTQLENFKAAVQLYEEAIKLDPNFALAHARLAAASARVYHFFEPTDLWKQRAKVEAMESLRLEPNLGEGRFALGLVLYWLEGNYAQALREFATGQALLPNDTEIGSMTAAVARREGRWEDALLAYQRIAEIDPQNPNILRNLVFTFGALRKWPEAVRASERWTALASTSVDARMQGAYMTFFWKGDTSALEAFLNTTPPGVDPEGALTGARWDVCMIKRDFAGADAALAASPRTELAYLKGGFAAPKSFFAGCVALARGDKTRAEAHFEEARPSFERVLQAAPESATRHANLGLLLAFLGRKDEAIAAGRRAVELRPEAKDAVDGPHLSGYLALIYARVGEIDLALPLLERLLHTPHASDSAHYSVSAQDLRLRWEWDPLRGDPRFQALLAREATP